MEIPGGLDAKTVLNSTSLALMCPYGNLDVVLLPDGTRGYPDLVRDSREVPIADSTHMRVASLRDIIRSKEAAGREKDRAVLPALRRLVDLEQQADDTPASGAPVAGRASGGVRQPGRGALVELLCRSEVCASGSGEEPVPFTVEGELDQLQAPSCPRCGALADPRDGRQLEDADLARGWYLHERQR